MTQRIYDLQARISADGTLALAVRDLITLPSGKRIEGDPRPVQAGDADVVAFVGTFNAAAVADAAAKLEAIAELQQQLAAITTERGQLAAELAAAQADIETQLETIADQAAALELLRNPPRVPTILTPPEFLERFTDDELDAIQIASDHPVARKAVRTLFTRLEVHLDNPLLAELIAGLVATGFLTAERAAVITAPREAT